MRFEGVKRTALSGTVTVTHCSPAFRFGGLDSGWTMACAGLLSFRDAALFSHFSGTCSRTGFPSLHSAVQCDVVLLFIVDEPVASTMFPLCRVDGGCDYFTLFGANARADILNSMIASQG